MARHSLAVSTLAASLLASAPLGAEEPKAAPAPSAAAPAPEAAASPAPTPAPAAPEAAPAPASDLPELKFEKFVLDNGLEVVLHEDHRLPVVAVSVWYHVGGLHEEKGKTGFAHLFEHLMFQGTPHAPGDAFFKILEQSGASMVNGTTDFDRTNYFEVVPRNELELALWLESSRMGWLLEAVDQAKLDEQRNVVKNERLQGIENVPYGIADEKLWQAMFPAEHPYRGMVIGSMEDLDRASLADVQRFFDAYYAPANATLSISGDIDVAATKALVDKYFKTLPKASKPQPRAVPAPALAAEVRVDAEDANAPLAKVSINFFSPAFFAPGDADLDVLSIILGSGNNSRLHQALRVDAQLAQEVGASQQSNGNVSVFSVYAIVKPGVDPENVLNALQAQVDLIKDLPPSDDEVKRAVNTIESDKVFGLQMVLARGEMLQNYNHYTSDPGFLAKDMARYRGVTPDTILGIAQQHLAKEKRAVLVVKPKPAAPPAAAPEPAAPAPAPAPEAGKGANG